LGQKSRTSKFSEVGALLEMPVLSRSDQCDKFKI
jgi:hypothetical protein